MFIHDSPEPRHSKHTHMYSTAISMVQKKSHGNNCECCFGKGLFARGFFFGLQYCSNQSLGMLGLALITFSMSRPKRKREGLGGWVVVTSLRCTLVKGHCVGTPPPGGGGRIV